ncbi:hypothetical protein ACHQM5_002788 [Ranunculus cassubicifolius]
MKITKTFLAIAVAMACAIALTITATTKRGEEELLVYSNNGGFMDTSFPEETQSAVPTARINRFLAQVDTRPKFHCNKDNEVCLEEGSPGSVCCNNKCIDVMTDTKNCGACKNKCKYTESCCSGKCVNLEFDKRHCGTCGKKCMAGGYCIYGLCDYAIFRLRCYLNIY